jgi:hypothetical protein
MEFSNIHGKKFRIIKLTKREIPNDIAPSKKQNIPILE